MERFIFKPIKTEPEDVFSSGDDKAKVAWVTAETLVKDADKHSPVIMLISWDLGYAGISFYDIAQFLYDNYTEFQIDSLLKVITGNDSVTIKQVAYESEEQLEELRAKASNIYDLAASKSKE